VSELRAQARRDRGKLRDLEHQVFLLEDRAETAERERERAGPAVRLPVEVRAPSDAATAGEAATGGDGAYQVVGVDDDGTEIIYIGEAASDRSVRPSLEPYRDPPAEPAATAAGPPPEPIEPLIAPLGPEDRIPVAASVPTIDNQLRRARSAPPPVRGTALAPAPVDVDAAQALYKRSYAALRAGDHAEAIAGLREFLRRFPAHDYADNAQYWLGEAYYDQKQYQRAIAEFRSVVTGYPRGNKVADALLKIGYSYAALGDRAKARDLLVQVTTLYPKSGPARLAAERLGQLDKE
jgi:tol-pal system protein YbgF